MPVNLDGSIGGTQGTLGPQPQEQTNKQKMEAIQAKYGIASSDSRGRPLSFTNDQDHAEFSTNSALRKQYYDEIKPLMSSLPPKPEKVTEQVKSTQVTSPQVKSTQVEKKEPPKTPSGKPISDKALNVLSVLGKIAVGVGLGVGGTVIGAGIGGAVGAVIGALFGGVGAAPGAVVGAVIGGLIGLAAGSLLGAGLTSGFIPLPEFGSILTVLAFMN